jgi:hypothetical protein
MVLVQPGGQVLCSPPAQFLAPWKGLEVLRLELSMCGHVSSCTTTLFHDLC